MNTVENSSWYDSIFKPYEDSIAFYANAVKQPQLPAELKINLQHYHEKVAVFRRQLKEFVAQHATNDSAAKALLITCFRETDLDLDSLLEIAQTLTGQGLHNLYADYFFQEIKGRKNNQVGKMFIPFSMTDAQNELISSDNFKGNYVLALFWASWCLPCRIEAPDLLAVYHQFKNKHFEVLAISVDTDKKDWLHAIHADKTDWYNLFDGKAWNSDVARNYAIHSIPQNLLLNPAGKIIAKNISAEGLLKILSAQ
jgi:thiol-disulfide isomerase/thioredoxin